MDRTRNAWPNRVRPRRAAANGREQSLVLTAKEAFADDGNNCVYCGCPLYGRNPARSHVIIVARPEGGGEQVTAALICLLCNPGEETFCWKRKDWDETYADTLEETQ